MTERMQRLTELTENLPDIGSVPELSDFERPIGGPVVLFGDDLKPSVGFGVYRDKDVGMMRAFVPKGAKVRMHRHSNEHEWIGIIRGSLLVDILDAEEAVKVGDCEVVHVPPGVPHLVVALQDTWCWSVTVPPASGYPDVTVCPFAAKAAVVV